ncbi:ATP-dependent DNA helicase RecQ [Hydrotalea sp.]|uniref:RecQ family ATP-dependent DNA helicase n=1 Tax=Hydrotalea sp. TaxID=2881279 RepID=UPI002619CA8E|nr:ATP-dependent DNA helicase RecQ [Hydrotalea sp.]
MNKKSVTPKEVLQQYWGYADFRGLQLPIIESVLEGKDTLALLPTGGGKSICFQVPALLKGGMALVISPLIALMNDQVSRLCELGITATTIESGLSYFEMQLVLERAAAGKFSFLYVSPERLQNKLFMHFLPDLPINLVVVDEAHCISQWGYDFRPAYLGIAQIKDYINAVPFMALTASATLAVQKDIIQQLQLRQPAVFQQSFARPTLAYSVYETHSKVNKTIELLQQAPGSSIVYCSTRKQTKDVAHLLQLQGLSAGFYHAGLTKEERNKKQLNWIQNKAYIIVCTNAFGMGIDKPDVRTVIHYNIPDCIENYYQEAGRAGRDNLKADAVLLCHPDDLQQLLQLPEKKFPPVETIRKVYQSLADFLQIPIGIGQGNYYDFDIENFIQNFKLDAVTLFNVLKVLEQEGHLSFNESVFAPSQIGFKVDKDVLFEFQKNFPVLEKITQTLLRTYQGILTHRVSIYERQIAKIARLSYDTVKTQLHQLHQYQIIEYVPQKDSPQIFMLLNRAPAASLHINYEQYHARKQMYTQRIQSIIAYAKENLQCRSSMIANYFSAKHIQRCGICDNCIRANRPQLNITEFIKIEQKILSAIPQQGIALNQLKMLFEPTMDKYFHEVLERLLDESVLAVDTKQQIFKKL